VEGQTVVTSDDHKLGTVIAERDDCVIIETGHVFKTRHAIPQEFLHDHDGLLRATVAKDAVEDSPKIDLEDWSCRDVREHYGLDGPLFLDPDPDATESAETDALRAGVKPATAERLDVLNSGADADWPVRRERPTD
jgi:hypothetical protein